MPLETIPPAAPLRLMKFYNPYFYGLKTLDPGQWGGSVFNLRSQTT